MPDAIYLNFLERQLQEALQLNAASDVIDIVPQSPRHYLVTFHCKGFVTRGGAVETADEFRAGIYFGPSHLRRIDPPSVVTWLGPDNIWHPNVRPPYVCIGNMRAGVGIGELAHQIYEMIGWRRYTLTHAMNWDAAQWARQNLHRIPADDRPLYRRTLNLKFQNNQEGAQ
jgi:hypothetical protein